MHSALYQGFVTHLRRQAPTHQFRYPMFMLYLDLDELGPFFQTSPLWSRERFNWASFHREDYLRPDIPDLKQAVSAEIERQTGHTFSGRVCLLGHLRYLGICFNPATFYFCFEGDQLKYVVTEVTNTPWQEKHTYVLTEAELQRSENTEKRFHVSPFLDMELQYRWRIPAPSQTATISIRCLRNRNTVFTALLELERMAATRRNLNRILFRFPVVTLKTISGIYWQALKLWLKGARFYHHPNLPEDPS